MQCGNSLVAFGGDQVLLGICAQEPRSIPFCLGERGGKGEGEKQKRNSSLRTAATSQATEKKSIKQAPWIIFPAPLFGASMRAIPHGRLLFGTTRRCARN